MKALSLWQPWASAIAAGIKIHETRAWSTAYRGPVAIHAAKRFKKDERDLAWSFMGIESIAKALATVGVNSLDDFPRGAIVAVADLIYVESTIRQRKRVSADDHLLGNWDDGRFAWGFTRVVPMPWPIPWSGSQGMWNWDHQRYFDTASWQLKEWTQEIRGPRQEIKQVCGQMGILCPACYAQQKGPCRQYFVIAEIEGVRHDYD